MPNYTYKCFECEATELMPLPISTDPKQKFACPSCEEMSMVRIICAPAAFTNGKQTLGKWYKENTGNDLLGGKK